MKKKPLIFGHRGYSAKFTENTVIALQKAIEYGADGVEFDIQKNKDGTYYIFHDISLMRLTQIDRKISDMTDKELQKVKINKDSSIPELSDLLKTCSKRKYVNIELKETISIEDSKHICQIVSTHFIKEKVIISSFNHSLLKYFRKQGLLTAALYGQKKHLKQIIKSFFSVIIINTDFVHLPIQIFSYFNKVLFHIYYLLIRMSGKRISFYTVNTMEDYNKTVKYAYAIITDEVKTLVKKEKCKHKKTQSLHMLSIKL